MLRPNSALALISFLTSLTLFGGDANLISFSTVNDVEASRIHLRQAGLWAFVNEASAQGVAAPKIHSKYWVDKLPVTNQVQEAAFRNFGYEIAVLLNDAALKFQKHPSRDEEVMRVENLLHLSTWLRQTGGYENYRMACRAEGAAGMVLARVIVNPEVSVETIEKLFELFLTEKQDAIIRADILWEESNGVFDVRDKARSFEEKGDFERDWNGFLRKASKKVDVRPLFHYTEFRSELEVKIPTLVFFCDDTSLPIPRSIVTTWDYKQHFTTCVFGGRPINLGTVRTLYLFRKTIGRFPTPPQPDADRDSYGSFYNDVWDAQAKRFDYSGHGAGRTYYDVIHNNFWDWEALEIVKYENNKRQSERARSKAEAMKGDSP